MRTAPPPQRNSFGPDDAEDESGGALLTRIGTVVGGGAIAAVLASLPAVLRVGDGGSTGRAIDEWVALSAVLMPVAILAVGVFRRARAGIKLLAGDSVTAVASGVLWWAVIETSFLSLVGTGLRAKTHHHGLAGVTFAMMALFSGLAVALLAVRATKMIAKAPGSSQRAGLIVSAGCAFLVIMLIGMRTAKSDTLHTAAALVDVLALVVAAAIASARGFSLLKPLALAGVPIAVIVFVLGIVSYRGNLGQDTTVLAVNAPFHSWIVSLVFGAEPSKETPQQEGPEGEPASSGKPTGKDPVKDARDASAPR